VGVGEDGMGMGRYGAWNSLVAWTDWGCLAVEFDKCAFTVSMEAFCWNSLLWIFTIL
jgi:hypothetical protein